MLTCVSKNRWSGRRSRAVTPDRASSRSGVKGLCNPWDHNNRQTYKKTGQRKAVREAHDSNVRGAFSYVKKE